MVTKSHPLLGEVIPAQRKVYEDQYAMVSIMDSIPCVKMTLNGVPQSSDHFQFVQGKMLESIHTGMEDYCRLHLLTDGSKAGVVLDEDLDYYKTNVVPAMEKAGIRYHAIVLPESFIVRLIINQITLSTEKLKVECFKTIRGASKWLRNR